MSSTPPPETNEDQGTVKIASAPGHEETKDSFIRVADLPADRNAEQPGAGVLAAQHEHLVDGLEEPVPPAKLLHIQNSESSSLPSVPSQVPIRRAARENLTSSDLLLGGLPWLYNKDRTRYGGQHVVPQELREIEDGTRSDRIAEFLQMMNAIPLTEEEKKQQKEWDELLVPLSDEPLDDDVVDAVTAWSEGRGEFPG